MKRLLRNYQWAAVSLVLLVGISAAFGLSSFIQNKVDTNLDTKFDFILEEVIQEVESWSTRPIYGLNGARSLFGSSDRVTIDEFGRYFRSGDHHTDFPGLRSMGFAATVSNDSLDSYILDQQEHGNTGFDAKPAQGLEQSWIVQYYESIDDLRLTPGTNLSEDTQFHQTLNSARDTGKPHLARYPHTTREVHGDLVWIVPVYHGDITHDTVNDRRSAIHGVLIGRFQLHALEPYLLPAIKDLANLEISHATQAGTTPALETIRWGDNAVEGHRLEQQELISIGGNHILIRLQPTSALLASSDQLSPKLIAVVGTASSIILAALIFNLGSSHRKATKLAASMTEQVRRLSMVAKNTSNAVMITDADHKIIWVNEGFTAITGYTPEECIGQWPGDLLKSENTDPNTLREIRETLNAGNGFTGELLNRAKDGTEHWLSLDIQPVRNAKGEITEFVSVESDLTAQKAAEQELLEAKLAAEHANDAKSRFLSGMSHEIRTPLNGIIGFADLLRRNAHESDPKTASEWINIIHSSGQHLLALLNDVLDLSKMDADQVDIALAPACPRTVVSNSVWLLKSRAVEQGLNLEIIYDDGVPDAIRTDATRVRQIVMNLVSNAVKFTKEGGVTVTVSAPEIDGAPRLRVAVKDTGIGMTQEQMSRLFVPFQQADKTIAEDFGGTGLGLSISRGLANRLGGDLTVVSAPGLGSCFTLEIEAPPLLPGETLNKPTHDLDDCEDSTSEASLILDGARILIADDVQANRQVAQLFLDRAGATTIAVEDGACAVQAVEDHPFDLILMDIQMPRLSGIDATEQIRAQGHDMPILALTAFSSGADRAKCLEHGMNDFLSKPFEPAILIQTAARWVKAGKVRPTTTPAAGHSEIHPELIPIALDWLAQVPGQLAQVERHIEQGNLEAAARVGHALKGSGGTLGLSEFTEPAEALESAALSQDTESAAKHLQLLRQLHSEARKRLAA